MPDLPETLAQCVPPASVGAVTKWWKGLEKSARLELAASWSGRAETCSYARGKGKWKSLPVLVGARFLPQEEEQSEDESWNRDFYEYLINNPELILHDGMFHICTAHSQAREVLRRGVIPAGFGCKLGRRDCPMQALLAGRPGCAVQLFPIVPVADAMGHATADSADAAILLPAALPASSHD